MTISRPTAQPVSGTTARALVAAIALSGALAGAGLLLAPGPAQADTATDTATATATDHETFADDAAGWTPDSSSTGLCVPQLLCPAVTAGYVAGGGSDGDQDGYLATTFTSLATTVAGTATGGWLSPAFTYTGVGGQQPTSLALDVATRTSLDSLLGLDVLDDSSYRIDLVDADTGGAISVVPTTPLSASSAWTTVPPAAISPDQLRTGHSYRVRITTTYHAAAAVGVSGVVGYDDLRLLATRTTSTDTTTRTETVTILPAPTVTTPPGSPAAGGITSTRMLRQLVRTQGLPKRVRLVGDHVRFKVSCAAIAAPKACTYAVQGLSAGKGSTVTTARGTVSVQPAASRRMSLAVKPRHLAAYRHAKRITIRAKVRVGVYKVTVVKKVRLIR